MMSLFKKNKIHSSKPRREDRKASFVPWKSESFSDSSESFTGGGDTKEKVEGLNAGLHEYDYKM